MNLAGVIIYWFIHVFCAVIFISIGIFALKRKTPVCFWAGSNEKIEKATFTNVKAYNRKCGIMFIIYAICIGLVGFIALFISKEMFIIIYLLVVIGGLLIMMCYYTFIYKQYTK
ncbi:MAG: hypothetical protein EOM50_06255 [Erysipelotrichia bacterium]|nr:hypothetical protein [Erysipelotrichia bacterium]NCC55373.1 hypothetical protein [Erysipelotrichia bacterium]